MLCAPGDLCSFQLSANLEEHGEGACLMSSSWYTYRRVQGGVLEKLVPLCCRCCNPLLALLQI